MDQVADMHAKLAQKAADNKKIEEQRKAEDDAKMMAAPSNVPPWSRNKSIARSSIVLRNFMVWIRLRMATLLQLLPLQVI